VGQRQFYLITYYITAKTMNEIDLEQLDAELWRLQYEKPIKIEIPPLAIFAIISNIQLLSEKKNDAEIREIALNASRQLQKIFSPDSCIYKTLEMGWNPEHDRQIKHEQ
jgi:hypothetical protein